MITENPTRPQQQPMPGQQRDATALMTSGCESHLVDMEKIGGSRAKVKTVGITWSEVSEISQEREHWRDSVRPL